jgi:hypothetical protein
LPCAKLASNRLKLKSEMSREEREGCEGKYNLFWKNFAAFAPFARQGLNFQLSTGNLQPLDYRCA